MLRFRLQLGKAPLFPIFLEHPYGPEGPSRNDLWALCLLFVHPLVFVPRGSKGKEEFLSTK